MSPISKDINFRKKIFGDLLFFIIGVILSIVIEIFVIEKFPSVQGYKYYSAFLLISLPIGKFLFDLWEPVVNMINSMIDLQKENMKKIEENHSELKNLNEQIRPGTKLLDIVGSLYNQSDVLRHTGVRSLNHIIADFTVDKGIINLKGEMLALLGYQYFWEQLIELQRNRKETGKAGLIAKITHSNPIYIWESEWANKSLQQQRRFIDAGGEVLRVLVDYKAMNTDIKKFIEVTKKMQEYKIMVAYLPLKDTDKWSNPKYDFLLIGVDDVTYSVQWKPAANRATIDQSITTEYKGNALIEEQDQLEKIIGALKRGPDYREGTPNTLTNIPSDMLEKLSI
ncbi:MAG: hypothetical protein LGR52_10815 [Candidatus Thiosymbion ectosymbiont of Robbea hypermnestra]|nr:hypothetical protein [Candidatus Thiosymbion ectosymbiont of Robbea hypermnestra]